MSLSSKKDKDGKQTPSEPTASFPLRVGAVDVGSNAIRLLAAEFTAPAAFNPLHEERVAVRLGHDVFLSGRLAPEVMDAATEALASFRRTLDSLDIRHYRAVATSAVRESRNGDEFVERVEDEARLTLEPITGSEEARLVHVAVNSRIPLQEGKWVLVDLGGGSVEISVVDETGILWSESHTMGSVRLLEELSGAGDEPGRFRRLLREYTSTLQIPAAVKHWKLAGMIATGGNMETLAKLANPSTDEREPSRVAVGDVRAIIDILSRLSYRERVEQLGLREDRADVILPAATVYERLASLVGAEEILVPHVGVKEGVLLDLVEDLTTPPEHQRRREERVLAGAINFGRRFMFEEAHGVHVAKLSLALFDQLEELHGLEKTDRLLLLAAATLHDVGVYLGYKRHHKHSLYLISQAELPGFTPREILMVANIARYHRKAEPAPHHELFMQLKEKERDRVGKLASLLRIADALDREHLQRVDDLQVERKAKSIVLHWRGGGDLLVEQWALKRKAQLFTRLFGLEVRLGENGDAGGEDKR